MPYLYNHEYLIFKNNELEGSECVKYGFPAAIYSIKEGNNFLATMRHSKGGNMIWKGNIDDGRTITGSVIWTNKKGKKTHYTFKGYQTKNTATKNKL